MGIAGVFNKIKTKIGRYRLSVVAVVALFLFFLLIIWTFSQLTISTIEKSRLIRSELFDRDLRELTGQFDSDERYVLEKNLQQFLKEQRPLSPLLLPRQYYVALPSGQSKFTPRLPPRNCFIDLIKQEPRSITPQKIPEKICIYFAENKNVGSYLFFSMAFVDSEINLLRFGDSSFTADSVKLVVKNQNTQLAWLLLLQPPNKVGSLNRYQLTAFRLKPDGLKELDKKIEGWAYVQKQANGSNVINLIARLDFKEFYTDIDREVWPPMHWDETRVSLYRSDISSENNLVKVEYKEFGTTNLSIPQLSTSIFGAYATLNVKANNKLWPVIPAYEVKSKFKESNSLFRFVDGDLLIRQTPIVRSQFLQDTNISFEVKHPGAVIEKGIWRTALYIIFLFLGFIALAAFFFFQLLKPIWILSRHSRKLINQNSTRADLPYSNRNDEIGALSAGFNELLRETRDQAIREHEERERRSEDVRKLHLENVKSRELNLQVIGHEIRSPLQALKSLHTEESISWRYIDRITRAVTQLFGASSPEVAFTLREINLESLDLGSFLFAVANNSPLANIPNVVFNGPILGVYVNIDPSVLEDALTNILINGDRYRKPNSPLIIKLTYDATDAIIEIFNDGPQIPENILEQIFELYFTTECVSENQLHGIGLYVAKNYISRMSGTISVHNEPSGVLFKIILPLKVKT